jgi:hypothetical protein
LAVRLDGLVLVLFSVATIKKKVDLLDLAAEESSFRLFDVVTGDRWDGGVDRRRNEVGRMYVGV